MKRIFTLILAVLLLAGGSTMAQQASPAAMTLDQCIDYAIRNSVSTQNAYLDVESSKARVRETTGIGLPQVVVASGITYNHQLPRFFSRYDPSSPFTGGTVIPGINQGDVIAAQNFFQLQSSADANVTINQLIFSGSYIVGLQAASAYKELAFKNAAVTKQTLIQNVMKAYYGVLINNERAQLFDANIARVDSLLRNTRALNENGFAEAIDVDRTQVTYNNLITERDKFLNMKELSLALLKFQMNYPMDEPLQVVGSIQDMEVETDPGKLAEGWDYKQRPDYQVLETNRRLQALNLKNTYAASLPTISAFAKGGYQTQSPGVAGLFKRETNLGENDVPGVGPDKYYSYSLLGLSLNWNLFTGMQNHYKVQQEKIALQKIDNNFRSLKLGIDLEIKQSTINFDNALKTLTSQRQNMDLAANVARVTRIKFEQGVGSNLEVVTAESSLKEAQNNYYNSLYDAMIAKVDLDKAYNLLSPPSTNK